jgi:hypothetical protein
MSVEGGTLRSKTGMALVLVSGMHCELIADQGNVVADLHLQKQPVGIALEDLSQMGADVSGGFAEPIHDSAQGCLVNTQHAGQAVLPNSGGVHAQLQVWVDVSI